VAGFAVTIAAYRPGLLTFDSILQFGQSQRGLYWDHHPPVMAWTWGMTHRVIPGPLGMLLLQAALMWLGLLLFADGAARRGFRHGWIIVAIGFLPPVIGIEGEIWKDVQMAAALLFAAGVVYRASAGGKGIGGIAAVLSLIALFYATAVRANAPAATGPILVYWAHHAFRRLSWRASVLAGAAALTLLLGAQWIFDNTFLHVEHVYLSQFLEIHDIAAIQCAGGAASIPASQQRAAAGARPLCEAFDPLQVDFLFAGPEAPLAATTDAQVSDALGREWRRAIAANPVLYLRHRLRVFGALLGEGVDDARRSVWIPSSIANVYGFTFAPNAITDAIGVGVGAALALGLYNGMLWLAAALAVLIAAARRMHRDRQSDAAALALSTSAITYTLPYFLVAVAPDYRYLYWTIIATAVGAALAMLPARRALHAPPPVSPTTASLVGP
jgi:hypothetical protein